MNMKKTKLGKLLPKIALLLAIVTLFTVVLTSCGSNTAISTSDEMKKAEYWQDKEIDLNASSGFIDKLLSYIGVFLGWITKIMPANNYILTLFVFAIILEIVMLPFSIKQQKNSIKQAKLRPKEMAIRKKYAGRNDQSTQQKVTQEIQELYQKENYNPMSGCMPLLLQLPILIVLYWIVVDPIQYVCGMSVGLRDAIYHFVTNSTQEGGLGLTLSSKSGSIEILGLIKDHGAEFFAGIKDFCKNGEDVYAAIETIDAFPANFNVGPLNFGLTPTLDFSTVNAWLLVLPVLTFFIYFFSMKLNRKLTFQPTQSANDRQQACSNNMMDFTMPLMSVWMTFIVPAAVGVYWIFKSILGVIKQFIMSKAMPLPKFTEEDYKAAEKELFGKQPKKVQKSENAGKVRSLHHIDDEDYDEKGNYVPKTVEPEAEVEEVKEALPENKMTEGATLKDDSDRVEKARKLSKEKQDKE